VASVLTTAGPSPRIVRQLVQAVVIPTITYGFPLWNPPNAKLWNKLESAVCLPLRCALALPSNTQRLAVMADFGIVGPRAQHQRAALSFAHRAATLPSEHTTRVLFDKQRQQPIRAVRKSYMPFANKVRKTEALWNINHADANAASSRSLTRAALEAQLQQLRNPFPKTRFSWLHLEPQPTPYILRDDRQTAQLRARIRLNRHHFNTRLFRMKLADTDLCLVCRVPESDYHIIYDCSRFALPRHRCCAVLDYAAVPLSLNVVTGDFTNIAPDLVAEVAKATADFLKAVNAVRPI